MTSYDRQQAQKKVEEILKEEIMLISKRSMNCQSNLELAALNLALAKILELYFLFGWQTS